MAVHADAPERRTGADRDDGDGELFAPALIRAGRGGIGHSCEILKARSEWWHNRRAITVPTPPPPPRVDRLLHDILTSRVYDVARETPLDHAGRLSRRLGNTVLLKREDQQPVFSFKLRGAYNRMAHLTKEERSRGVITASAGNHSQGVAFSARRLGMRALIVMPQTTPSIKVDAVRDMGAEVVLIGDSYADAQAHCEALIAQTGLTFVHPFDDPLVIAGQGTIADEILRHGEHRTSAIFVPVGGGGLIAGIAGYVKAIRPEVKVIGVEPFEADAMHRSLAAGRRIRLEHVGIFADGVAVREVGERTFPIVRESVDEIVRVTNDEVCAAIKDVFDDTRSVMEPAGALGVAGLKTWVTREGVRDQQLVVVLSGANMNFDRLRFVAERAELGEAREALLAVTIPERPGAFREFCATIGRRVVTEFNYRISGREHAHIFVGVATTSRQDATELAALLTARGYDTVNLADDEMAKLHVRHMVGGRAPDADHERLCRFQFPERPGALMEFLDKLGGRWNISLFHYRNHGADFGRVLAGFEVPDAEMTEFGGFLERLGYDHVQENENPAYTFFLR
jgi:threonine dehydratase